MKKLLITGGSGLLGRHFIQAFSKHYQITATHHKRAPYMNDHVEWINLDYTDFNQLNRLNKKFDYILHLAAITHPETCEKYPKQSKHINFELTKRIVDLACKVNAKLIFTSTDLVFDGHKGFYCENDSVNPGSYYAEHKALAESFILDNEPNSLVARLSVQLTKDFNQGFYFDIIQKLKSKSKLNVFNDEFRSFTFACDTVRWLEKLKFENGIWHLANTGGCSRSQLAYALAKEYNYDPKYIDEISSKSIDFKAYRPKDTRLCIDKFKTKYADRVVDLKAHINSI